MLLLPLWWCGGGGLGGVRGSLTQARRSRIGAELFMVGEEKPFKFPAAFTFVFRAFTTLDGIGKGLDEKYDIARLAQVRMVHRCAPPPLTYHFVTTVTTLP